MQYIGQYLENISNALGLESVAVLLLLVIAVTGVIKCIR